jgi:hypothetical protein
MRYNRKKRMRKAAQGWGDFNSLAIHNSELLQISVIDF